MKKIRSATLSSRNSQSQGCHRYANGDKKDAAAQAADGDQMGAANAFMKVGVKVVKKKKKIDDDLDMEEEAADGQEQGQSRVKKGRVNTK